MGFSAQQTYSVGITTSAADFFTATDTDGIYQVEIDATALALGDAIEVKLYQKFDSADGAVTQLGETIYLAGPRASTDLIGVFDTRNQFKVTGKTYSGTNRTIRCVLKPVA